MAYPLKTLQQEGHCSPVVFANTLTSISNVNLVLEQHSSHLGRLETDPGYACIIPLGGAGG